MLVETGWANIGTFDQYFEGHPFPAKVRRSIWPSGAMLVGIDSLNIDDTNDGARPVHSTLLAAEVPIVEHLCGLAELPDKDFRFFAVPVKVKGMGTFPVRAFGWVR